jgi:hypothetical protein
MITPNNNINENTLTPWYTIKNYNIQAFKNDNIYIMKKDNILYTVKKFNDFPVPSRDVTD